MNDGLAEVTGELMARLHTATSLGDVKDLDIAIVRFARYFRKTGAARQATVDPVQRLLDQVVASANLADGATACAADVLASETIARCIEVYDAWPRTPG